MANYFAKFPKSYYKLNSNVSLDLITNITSRFSFEKSLKDETSAYYTYLIRDGDTPENLAYKLYDSAERHWIILSFNEIYDPQFDWPLKTDEINRFIENKYARIANVNIISGGSGYSNGYMNFTTSDGFGRGANAYFTVNTSTGSIETIKLLEKGSGYKETPNVVILTSNGSGANISVDIIEDPVDWARGNIKSYYKIQTITTSSGVSTEKKIEISADTYANLSISYDSAFILADNNIVSLTTTKETQSYYDYELELNDSKRTIRILQKQFVPELESSLKDIFET